MLPVSGAEQLKTSAAIGERPMISHSGAYSRLVRPAPRSLSGIGGGTAIRFAAEGARVACVDRAAAAADETAAAIKGGGGEAFGFAADVTDEASCGRMVAAAVERFGGLTTVVNSAGVGPQR